MNGKKFVFPLMGILIIAALALVKCEGGGTQSGAADSTNAHLNSPAPDNNSATNPSMADTAYQHDSTIKRRDTPR